MKRLSACLLKEYDNATLIYNCRNEFVEGEAKASKIRDYYHVN